MTRIKGDPHANSAFQHYRQTLKVASRKTAHVAAARDATIKARDACLVQDQARAGTKEIVQPLKLPIRPCKVKYLKYLIYVKRWGGVNLVIEIENTSSTNGHSVTATGQNTLRRAIWYQHHWHRGVDSSVRHSQISL